MNIFDEVLRSSELAVSTATFGTLVWGLIRMFKSAREAAAVRMDLLASNARTEAAAAIAADHAIKSISAVAAMADNVQKIELASNSMKDALVAATDKASGLAGEQRGREQEKKRQEDEK